MERYRFKNIEFLRFIFILAIIYRHLNLLTSKFSQVSLFRFIEEHLTLSSLAVDFFFILSGFLLLYTLNTDLSVIDFLKRKARRLWSVVAFATIGYLCLNFFNIHSYGENVYNSLFSFVFMDNIGITLHHCGPSWYVSVLMLVSLFYFYLYKALPEKIVNLIVGVLVWFAYTYTINIDDGNIRQHIQLHDRIFCMGLLRGIGGMGIGMFLCQFYKNKIVNINTGKTWGYTFIESCVLSWCMYVLWLSPQNLHNTMIVILGFTVLIGLFVSRKGYLSSAFENNVSIVLGRYVYSIFLSHLLIFYILRSMLTDNYPIISSNPIISLIVLYLGVILLGIIVYHFIERPQNKLFNKLGYLNYYAVVFGLMLIVSYGCGVYLHHKPLSFGKVYNFSENYMQISSLGLSHTEKWGRWSDGKNVKLKFYVKNYQNNLRFDFKIKPYLNPEHPQQKVGVFANDKKVAEWQFEYKQKQPETFFILSGEKIKDKRVKVNFVIENPISPQDLGLSDDKRKLGVGLISMKIKKL